MGCFEVLGDAAESDADHLSWSQVGGLFLWSGTVIRRVERGRGKIDEWDGIETVEWEWEYCAL